MRKAQKEQVEELLRLLEQAHEEIKRNIEKRNFEPVLVTLADCQDCAVAMGNLIEESEGENFVTISFLEKYCEAVYQIYQSIANGENVDANKTDKVLRKVLIAASNSARNDIRIRKEVVFFPYKASMWDSLESVYLAAKADPDCDAYCVPIPYFDKNPDGTVKEMHYEGREYPANIEIIDWQSYSFEERKPDAIYIHNPYDQFNYVTSVHPRFYASNLQKYTNELVYIPYFVLTEIEPDDQVAIEGMKHFCYLPGTIYADKVILQSENMRQIYINEYMKACKRSDDQELRKDLEKRFFGTGSPKFDKVLNTKIEDLEIPTDWLKIIEKPDGSLKKIIFYNTSIGALLQHDKKMLEKMKDVFKTFKENKSEVALLWRPHPLIQATIESMRPQLWAQYKEIVEQYKSEGWGIYDDSADLDRAVVLSDAYYGDESSVVELCQKAEMPIMVQNVQLSNCNMDYNVQTELIGAVKVNNLWWVCPSYFNKMIAFDICTKDVMECYEIPVSEGYGAIGCFCSMEHVGKRIYLIPYQEKKILQFDLETKKFSAMELDKRIVEKCSGMFISSRVYKNYLFMVCAEIPVIVRLDTRDNSIMYINVRSKDMGIELFNDKGIMFGQQNVLWKNKIFVPFRNKSAVLEINCEDLVIKIHRLNDFQEGYDGVCYSDGNMWLVTLNNKKIVRWDIATEKIDFIDIPRTSKEDNIYIGIVSINNTIRLFPRIIEEKDVEQENVYVIQGGYCFIKEDEDKVMYYEYVQGILHLYDKRTEKKEDIEIKIHDKFLDINKVLNNRKLLLYENRNLNLTKMISV